MNTVLDVPRADVQSQAFGGPIPPQPLSGQSKPPCENGETVINGACWVEVAKEKPPCGSKHFEYEKRCYVASFYTSRSQPNTIQP